MKVSVNWIRNLNNLYKTSADPAPKGFDDLVQKIGAQLGAVDEVVDLGKQYEGVLVVKVVICEKHPNADKLSLCFIDDGGKVKKVERNKDGLVQVVCGAPNVKSGILAAWIPPGATVPSTYEKDPFVLDSRELRGKISNGMLASPKELALGDSHEGILEIKENVKPGTTFSEVYKLDDYIIDVENKMFTHRPDLFGQLGIAREIAGIYGHTYKSPAWYKVDAPIPVSKAEDTLKITLKNEIPKIVPRFVLLSIKDVKVGPSPVWMQSVLSRIGVKSINNIVDITNYYTYLTSQPSHAYDYDKVVALSGGDHARFVVRKSKKGEKLKLLGGKEITLDEGAIMIATDKQAIGLGAVMGGADTEVDENTKNIVLEVANFDMYTVRRMSMTYGLFTDASTRFTKGQSPLQNQAVVAKLAEEVLRHAGGRISGGLIDDNHLDEKVLKMASLHASVTVTPQFINERLGLKLSQNEIKRILENVEFDVSSKSNALHIKTPFWRTDIEIPEDIVEEVGRLYGYDKLPMELPKRSVKPTEVDRALEFKARIRGILARAGANEVLTYSFVHGNLLEKVGQDKSLAYKLNNAISPDLQYYRLSLTPSLLEKINPNIKAGYKEFAIFELNKTHNKKHKEDKEPDLPKEFNELALVYAATEKTRESSGAAYFQARKFLDYLAGELGIKLEYSSLSEDSASKFFVTKPFEASRSAKVSDAESGTPVGFIGEFKSNVAKSLKLPNLAAGFELDLDLLLDITKSNNRYTPLNKYPSVEQDITLKTGLDIPYARLEDFLNSQLKKESDEHGYMCELIPLDIFQKENDKSKNTSFRITLYHPNRTLTLEETNKILDNIAEEAKVKLKAERI